MFKWPSNESPVSSNLKEVKDSANDESKHPLFDVHVDFILDRWLKSEIRPFYFAYDCVAKPHKYQLAFLIFEQIQIFTEMYEIQQDDVPDEQIKKYISNPASFGHVRIIAFFF